MSRRALGLDAGDVARAVGAAPPPPLPVRFASVSIDSRTVRIGDLFFAIRGPRFDGHAFVADALARGAAGVVVSDPSAAAGLGREVPVFVVRDTLSALQALAREVRTRSGAKVVAITGSAGKTTTKEITAALLDGRFETLRNRGNLNNHIGLPLSLMELTGGADVAVMELGMNHAGEIRQLVAIATPDVRVWINVGTAHLEYFGSQDAIAAAKAEILEGAGPDTLFVANADDRRVVARAASFPGRVLTFGVEAGTADVRATDLEDAAFEGASFRVETPRGSWRVESALPGRGNVLNVLAATAVAIDFGVPGEEIRERVAAMRPAAHRGELKRLREGIRLVDDCYNSSPSALELLLRIAASDRSGRRRVAFLGEMLELGEASEALHAECGRAAADAGVAALVSVGGEPARAMADAARGAGLGPQAVRYATSSEEAAALVGQIVRPGDLVLVKGSRGIRMERVVERVEAEFG